MDISIEDHGTLFLFRLNTPAAKEWVEENVSEPNYLGDALVVEHRFARDLAEGMVSDGLTVS